MDCNLSLRLLLTGSLTMFPRPLLFPASSLPMQLRHNTGPLRWCLLFMLETQLNSNCVPFSKSCSNSARLKDSPMEWLKTGELLRIKIFLHRRFYSKYIKIRRLIGTSVWIV